MSDELRPFQIEISDGELDDLRRRLGATRWPEPATVDDWSQGLPLAYARELCEYWASTYDWRSRQSSLNRHPQFLTEIDGLEIHFLHQRSPDAKAIPLLLSHGWPGSVVEFDKVIGPLSDPASHGSAGSPAFHVVCPSLPGYGFSGKPTTTGWGVPRIADAWATLMARLGYDAYVAQGGDWGAGVTTALGRRDPAHLLGIHLNMPVVPPSAFILEDLTPSEQRALDDLGRYQRDESGYSKQQSTRPQTLGYGLTDSPVGQMAWIVEKFYAWTDCDGHPESVLSKDEMLDNVMYYWLSRSAASSGRLYWESFDSMIDEADGPVKVPTGCSIYPKEIIRISKRWAEGGFSDLRYWNELDRGGHFAAFEQPDCFVDELRSFVLTLA